VDEAEVFVDDLEYFETQSIEWYRHAKGERNRYIENGDLVLITQCWTMIDTCVVDENVQHIQNTSSRFDDVTMRSICHPSHIPYPHHRRFPIPPHRAHPTLRKSGEDVEMQSKLSYVPLPAASPHTPHRIR
jgi:hypothetical protein